MCIRDRNTPVPCFHLFCLHLIDIPISLTLEWRRKDKAWLDVFQHFYDFFANVISGQSQGQVTVEMFCTHLVNFSRRLCDLRTVQLFLSCSKDMGSLIIIRTTWKEEKWIHVQVFHTTFNNFQVSWTKYGKTNNFWRFEPFLQF